MAFLVWLNESGLAKWVGASQSLWAYPTILTSHTLGMGILVGLNSVIDLRILGVGQRLALAPMERLYPLMWLGFWINAVSGSALFIADAITKAENPVFYVKLIFVALAVVNMWLLRSRVFRHPGLDEGPLPKHAKILAGTSLVFWTGAITAGRLMAYIGQAG